MRTVINILEWILTISAAIAIAILLRSNVFALTEVKMSSMEDTLFEGQKVLEYKLVYRFRAPQRGEIIILDREDRKPSFFSNVVDETREMVKSILGRPNQNHLIKRVIAVPGDRIDIRDGLVYINDKELKEVYVKGKTYPFSLTFPTTVPENKVFVMGDNREISQDSRQLGFIDYSQIEGRAVYRIWPFDKIGSLEHK